MASNLDTWMALFKGEMTFQDICYGLAYKRLLEIVDARVKRMEEEQKQLNQSSGIGAQR